MRNSYGIVRCLSTPSVRQCFCAGFVWFVICASITRPLSFARKGVCVTLSIPGYRLWHITHVMECMCLQSAVVPSVMLCFIRKYSHLYFFVDVIPRVMRYVIPERCPHIMEVAALLLHVFTCLKKTNCILIITDIQHLRTGRKIKHVRDVPLYTFPYIRRYLLLSG